jgi:hypothetical protein
MPHQINSEMRKCIDNFATCRTIGVEPGQNCLEPGDKRTDPGHIPTLLDCPSSV